MLIGINLRPIMASVSPLLSDITKETTLTNSSAGLLTTLPVLSMGVFALIGGILQRKLGIKNAVFYGLAIIFISTFSRFFISGGLPLIVSALTGGIGIAIIQALLPGLIKKQHGKEAGKLMTFFTVGIMGGAMLTSIVSPLISSIFSWEIALGMWCILAILASALWTVIPKDEENTENASTATLPYRSPRAWLLLIFFGIGTAAYTLVLAWLPPYYVQLGWSNSASGLMLGGLTFVQVISAISLSTFINKFTDRRPLLFGILATVVLGLACLIFYPSQLAAPALLLLGVGIGTLFPTSLVITVDHLEDASQAGALLGFVQGGGYIIASIMPFLAGVMRDFLNSMTLSWAVMLCAILIMLFMVPPISPGSKLSSVSWALFKAN